VTQEKGKPRSEEKKIGGVRAQEPTLTNQGWGTLKFIGSVAQEVKSMRKPFMRIAP